MQRQFSSEFRLMVECARWPPSARRTEAIRKAVESDRIDGDLLLRLAQRHRVIGLVYNGLAQIGPSSSDRVVAEFEKRAKPLVQRNLTMAAEAVRLQHLFIAREIPVVFLKGVSLSTLIYGDTGLRQSDDIDLLVPFERFAEASTIIEQAGYQRYDPPPQLNATQLSFLRSMRRDFGYIHREKNLRIELHWSLFANPHFMIQTPFWLTSRAVELSSGIQLRTLNEEDLFAYLCAHGGLHWWNRLQWLADVNALVASASSERIGKLCEAAEARGVGRAASYALFLCHDVFSTEIPEQSPSNLASGTAMNWMRRTALDAMGTGTNERERASIAFGTTRGSLSTLLLKKGWRYRLAELRGLLTCQDDIVTVRLPYALWFLYPILRFPLWIWRQIGRYPLRSFAEAESQKSTPVERNSDKR